MTDDTLRIRATNVAAFRELIGLFCELLTLAWNYIRNHPMVVWTLGGGLVVLLGALYSLFFYLRLGIPILDLAAPSDFLLPGLRHALVLLPLAIVAVLVAVITAFVLVSLLFSLLRYVLIRVIQTARTLVKFLLVIVGCATTVVFVAIGTIFWAFPFLVLILAYRTITTFAWFFRSFRAKLSGRNNLMPRSKDRSSIFSDTAELRKQCSTLANGLIDLVEATDQSIDHIALTIQGWLFPEGINAALLRRLAIVLFVVFTISCVLGLTYGKADRHSTLVRNVQNAANVGTDCRDTVGVPRSWNQQVNCFFRGAFWPISPVTVQFQDSPTLQSGLLQLGVTSSYMLFWLVEENGDNRPLIVPKSFVTRIFPGSAGAGIEIQESAAQIVEELRELNDSLPDVIADAELERLARFLAAEMECENEAPDKMSDLIRFARNSDEVREQQSLEIGFFTLRLNSTDANLKVFGFASAEGIEASNSGLAASRAENVFAEMEQWCGRILDGCPEFDRDSVVVPVGEDHFINGVANSRSAIMAVCDSS